MARKVTSPDSTNNGYTILPLRGWSQLDLREVWEYRDLIWSFAIRDFNLRYRQMALGAFWSIISPLVDMVLFSVLFGSFAKMPSEGIPYPIFVYTALIPWGYFSGITNSSAMSLVSEMDIISKIYFPRLLIPFASIFSLLFENLISLLILLGMTAYFHITLTWKLMLLPVYLLLAAITGLGIGMWLATFAVRYRDVRNLSSYGLQVFKFITPVLYSATLIPTKWQFIYRINPMYWVVEGFRWIILGSGQPPSLMLVLPFVLTILILVSGMFFFRRTERTIVDWL